MIYKRDQYFRKKAGTTLYRIHRCLPAFSPLYVLLNISASYPFIITESELMTNYELIPDEEVTYEILRLT